MSVWAANLGNGVATVFHAAVEEVEEGTGALTGMPDLGGAAGAILLADPVTFPTDAVLRFLSESTPMLPLLGGLASGRTASDETILFIGDEVVDDGAVGVRLDGVEVLPMVSQGATPLGPELTITAAEGHVIGELAGKPALDEAARDDRRTAARGPAAGAGRAAGRDRRGLQQARLRAGRLPRARPRRRRPARPATWRSPPTCTPGQVVRLHARDAESADRDLREALAIRMTALGGRPPAGALLFACNGRGAGMFGRADHDVDVVADALAGAPGGRVLRGGRDRADRRRVLPAQFHGNRGGLRMNLERCICPADRRHRRASGRRSRARSPRAARG